MRSANCGREPAHLVGWPVLLLLVAWTAVACEEFTPIDSDTGDTAVFDVGGGDGETDQAQPDVDDDADVTDEPDTPTGDAADGGDTEHTLTVVVSGPGEVTASPGDATCSVAEFDCEGATSSECPTQFDNGTTVTLSAAGTDGGSLVRWEGAAGCGAAASCEVDVTADQTVTAVFGYGVGVVFTSICGDGEGSSVVSDPTGIATAIGDPGTSGALFDACSTVTLTATSMGAAEFDGWGGSCSDESTEVCTLTMDAGHSVNAAFPCAGGELTVNVEGFGTVSSDVAPDIDCDETNTPCIRSYNAVVTLTATPSARGTGWTFDSWADCPSPSDDTCEVDLRDETDHEVTATFTYDVSYSSDVYPLFQSSGCTTCHDSGHVLGLDFELNAAQVYDLLTEVPATNNCGHLNAGDFRINPAAGQAADSLLLVYANPDQCAGPPPAFSHPGAVWATDSNEYETVFDWIDGGAPEN